MRTIFLLIAVSLFLAACASKKPEDFVSDQPLYDYALKLYDNRSYTEAIPFFESLRNRFPQSPHATVAELKIADANYEMAEYAEAEIHYQNFRSLHPTHAKTSYVMFQLAMCSIKRAPKSMDRDQTHREKAITILEELLARWPSCQEAKKAGALLHSCKETLAKRELSIANFYLRHKQYSAAVIRLQGLYHKRDFPDLWAQATYKLGVAYKKTKQPGEAKEVLTKLLEEPKAQRFHQKAKDLLQTIHVQN